ncbi:hypothetical protein BC332_27774 [Capsicum chinense]|nr:hypothetical protein BC332_27774 [Capsicum chinense]
MFIVSLHYPNLHLDYIHVLNCPNEPDFDDIAVDVETFTLIYATSEYISPNGIGLGSMLLVSPTTTIERSTSPSSMEEDDASFTVNILVEKPLVLQTTSIEHPTSSSSVEEDNVDCSIENSLSNIDMSQAWVMVKHLGKDKNDCPVWYRSSPSTAVKISTLSTLALRVYALEYVVLYDCKE